MLTWISLMHSEKGNCMTNDKKLEMFFDHDRWEMLIDRADQKGIDKKLLISLCEPKTRVRLLEHISSGKYRIAPPHIAEIPKDDGTMREVFVNEPIDRIFLSLYNDLMFELYHDAIHPACKSYQKGIGCGKIVKEISARVADLPDNIPAYKADLSKYFDSVNLQTVEKTLKRFSTGSVLDQIIWEYYHNDLVFDKQNNLIKRYGSLKQGCAFASFLANVILYPIDEVLSHLDILYVRYSDDILMIGPDAETAITCLKAMLTPMGLALNPKKIERIRPDKWFSFLGFSIKGTDITFSKKTVRNFQKEIEHRTIKNRKQTVEQAVRSVNSYLHRGYIIDGNRFGFGSYFLPIVNVKADLITMDNFVKDCIRAVDSGKRTIGGIGVNTYLPEGVVQRGKGKNVTANRQKWKDKYGDEVISGYYTLSCMQNAIRQGKSVYESLVRCAA